MSLCPDVYQARGEAVAQEESAGIGELDTALFVCTLAFPSMPTFLHIFEPRYRLMIRRAVEGNGQFGMVMYNRVQAPQGDLGNIQFTRYGTMLQILNVQLLADGRSLIETRGAFRFKVKSYGALDGYTVGSVERVEDVSLAEEERLEAEETTAHRPLPQDPDVQAALATENGNTRDRSRTQQDQRPLESLSTSELLRIGMEFIIKMRANSAPWLHQNILDSYGPPADDPAEFPYWFASILPIADEEKYVLLQTTSIRQRLKIVVGWIRRIEGQRW